MIDKNFWTLIQSLSDSGSTGGQTGWTPKLFEEQDSKLLTFAKSHSYGEYIFDWGWAEAYERYGVPYYPKLTSMIPFTPVTTTHFFGNHDILKTHDEFYNAHNFSSAHFLFLETNEIETFRNHQYMIRESMQYHFVNEGHSDFTHFLTSLKTKKAKNLLHERKFSDLKIISYTKDQLNSHHAKQMYEFYISTIVNKNSFDYLNEKFFELIFERMKGNLLYIEATRNDEPIAGTMFFYDEEKIYGRYWGSKEYVPNLHFELCYYQGIDFCLQNKLKVFEAGAQGEHKIARGFRPVKVFSAHKIKHDGFREAISNFIDTEKKHVEQNIRDLSELLPFKK
jgi:predicted N-acyltransferase